MSPVRAALLGLATLAGSGCFTARPSGPDWFYHHAARNLTEKPIAHHDERKFTRRVERRADEAWEQACGASGRKHGDPYHDGFREGFVDYVEAGGTGEPPYLPPFRYRLTKYRTAEGIRAVEEWYAGFRHGAAVARGSGLRELNYVPLPGPPVPADARTHAPAATPFPTVVMMPAPAPAPAPPAPPGGAPDFLPPPRPAPGPQMPPPTPPAIPPATNQGAAKPAPGMTSAFIPATLPTGPSVTGAPAKPVEAVRWSGWPAATPAKPSAATRPPVVVVESGATADAVRTVAAGAPTPAPVPTATPRGDFSPWQPSRPEPQPRRAPSISRE